MIIDMLDTILDDLDKGSGASSTLVSLDFEKAFNRISHDACIAALQQHGATKISIQLVHSFLKDRTMRARVGSAMSTQNLIGYANFYFYGKNIAIATET